MATIADLFDPRSTAQLTRPEETALDRTFRGVAQTYLASETDARSQMRSEVPDDGRVLLVLSSRAASAAKSMGQPHLLEIALAGHLLEDFKWDVRENIRLLDPIWNIAREADIDAADLFERMAKFGSESARGAILDFVQSRGRFKLNQLKKDRKRQRPRR
jgi:hypothetical protein